MSKAGKSGMRTRDKYRLRRARLAATPVENGALAAEQEDLSPQIGLLEEQLSSATTESGQLREHILRQKAEFDNFRRRVLKEKEQIRESAREDLLGQLLPVVDNFDRALQAAERNPESDSLRKGVEMISDQLKRVLEGAGLSPIEALGKPFNPQEHEALAMEERSDVPENHVCEVMLPGYRFGEKVIRAAMVKVARAAQGQQDNAQEEPETQPEGSRQG